MTSSMPLAQHFNDPQHWYYRSEEARRLAEQMRDETAKRTMLRVADVYEMVAVRAAKRSIDELFVRRIVNKTKGS